MPRHIAVILDGNRRWAKKRERTPVEGYDAGLATLGTFLSLCRGWNIPILSLFLFSSENWGRPKVSICISLNITPSIPNSLPHPIFHISQRTTLNENIFKYM
ncbi:Dehydrodolichyl diphosphate synthase 2 [Bienertia sinuspersici]